MYKYYNTNQLILPMDLRLILNEKDIAILISKFVETIPESAFAEYGKKFGRPKYNPRMMFSIILCAYSQKVVSGRKIAELVEDSIRMRWLSGGEMPDFRTINRFRIDPIMDNLLETAFLQFRNYLLQNNIIKGDALFIDGTKIEADANKFTFVWKKAVDKFEAKLDNDAYQAYRELVKEEILPELIDELKEELTLEQLEEIRNQLLRKKEIASDIREKTKGTPKAKLARRGLTISNILFKKFNDYVQRKGKYIKYREILKERNSFSKTDEDATFMRMKDDYMKNGQLKAGFNIQAASENQFVLAYDIFPNPTDTKTLIPFLNKINKNIELPEHIVADAGYGSEENYQYILDELERIPLITYNSYRKEQSRKWKKNKFCRENWVYNELDDEFICPNDKKVKFRNYSHRKDSRGFVRDLKVYESEDCGSCPVRNLCTKAKAGRNRTIQLNPTWEYFKSHVRELLSQGYTSELYKQRKIDIEPVFGNIKHNLKFTRFHVRGKEKVNREMGLIFLAHNFRKLLGIEQENQKQSLKNELLGA